MNTPKYGLSRSERLRGRKLTDRLFAEGNSGFVFPLRYFYLTEPFDGHETSTISMMVSVPKRHFKRAVKRNLLKRRVREAFRLNKHILQERLPDGTRIMVAFIYGHNEVAEFPKIQSSIRRILSDIDKKNRIQQPNIPNPSHDKP